MLQIFRPFLDSFRDLLPIILVIGFFQLFVLQQPIPHLEKILTGVLMVVIGLTLFPRGEGMAYAFARKGSAWWLFLFAFALGFGATIAEPALIALGTFRIVTGAPLHCYIIAGYAPRSIIALAYDSGGVMTSTVTVPLVTALGLPGTVPECADRRIFSAFSATAVPLRWILKFRKIAIIKVVLPSLNVEWSGLRNS